MSEHLVLDVAVVGDSGVGKTTLLQEELEEEQSSSLDPTLLGIRLRHKTYEEDSSQFIRHSQESPKQLKVRVRYWDCTGSDQWSEQTARLCAGCCAVVYVFDGDHVGLVTSRSSFAGALLWIDTVRKYRQQFAAMNAVVDAASLSSPALDLVEVAIGNQFRVSRSRERIDVIRDEQGSHGAKLLQRVRRAATVVHALQRPLTMMGNRGPGAVSRRVVTEDEACAVLGKMRAVQHFEGGTARQAFAHARRKVLVSLFGLFNKEDWCRRDFERYSKRLAFGVEAGTALPLLFSNTANGRSRGKTQSAADHAVLMHNSDVTTDVDWLLPTH